jgi:hypothetical protein
LRSPVDGIAGPPGSRRQLLIFVKEIAGHGP